MFFQSEKIAKKSDKGSILILALVILATLLFLGTYFLSFGLTGANIAQSEDASLKTYYLAEAGISEAIYRLKNDPNWKDAFETVPSADDPNCSSWSIPSYTRSSALFSNGGYTITVHNLGCATAEIDSQAFLNLPSGGVAQRIVKAKVFKPTGSPVSDYMLFASGQSGDISISISTINVYNGNIFSNNNMLVKFGSTLNVDKKAYAHGNIVESWASSLNATSCAANVCDSGCDSSSECPPDKISMPSVDFDSDSPNSLYNQAASSDCSSIRTDGKNNCIFTSNEFDLLMSSHSNSLSLPTSTVVYVTGDINIKVGQEIIVNGLLVSDRDVNIGQGSFFDWLIYGGSEVTVNRPGTPDDNQPAGILAKRKINVGSYTSKMDINGVLYSGDKSSFSALFGTVNVHGGIAAGSLSFSSLGSGFNLYLDPDVIIDTLKGGYSPIINIDHWEEEY